MKAFLTRHSKGLFLYTSLLLILTLLLVACSGSNNGNSAGTKPTTHGTSLSGGSATPATTPVIGLGARPCPDAVKAPAHWDSIVPTQSNTSRVETVTCGNLIGNSSLQALVTVRNSGSGGILDIYVYTGITSPGPVQLFKLLNLIEGDAKISLYNTILTGEVDTASSINAGKSDAELTQDLYREFKWSDGAGTFVPVSFPGIFPDLTRFQAEKDQEQVNQGQDAWKLSPTMVASHLATDPNLLKWTNNISATIMSGGGAHDTGAVVSMTNADSGGTISVTLQRLEGNANGGIWEVVAAGSDGMSIIAPQSRDRIGSPVTVNGAGKGFEGVIGTVFVLDHLYKDIGNAQAHGTTSFSTMVTYQSSFNAGAEEGVLALYAYSSRSGGIAGAVMVKELL